MGRVFTVIVAISLMPGSVLSALQALSELYTYPHDCNSLYLRFAVVPPAGSSHQAGNTGDRLVSVSSPHSTFLPAGDGILESHWAPAVSCSQLPLGGQARGPLRKDGQDPEP